MTEAAGEPMDGFDVERIVARTQGREGWLREAHRQLEQERCQNAGPVPRSRAERLRLAAESLKDDLAAERRGNRAYEAFREYRRLHDPRRLGGPPKPYTPPGSPSGEVNVTDPDSRRMKGNRRYIQGYNAQAVVNEQQIVLAAEISTAAGDFSHLRPMIETALHQLQDAGVTGKPTVAVADAQYWNEQHMDDVIAEHGIPVLIPPDSGKRKGERPGWTGGRYSFMRRVLTTDLGRETYRKRQQSIEPVFGNTKHNRKIYRFNYRGRSAGFAACTSRPTRVPALAMAGSPYAIVSRRAVAAARHEVHPRNSAGGPASTFAADWSVPPYCLNEPRARRRSNSGSGAGTEPTDHLLYVLIES